MLLMRKCRLAVGPGGMVGMVCGVLSVLVGSVCGGMGVVDGVVGEWGGCNG